MRNIAQPEKDQKPTAEILGSHPHWGQAGQRIKDLFEGKEPARSEAETSDVGLSALALVGSQAHLELLAAEYQTLAQNFSYPAIALLS